MGEKTEQASPKKLRDARKKGQVAKSQDLPSAFTFIVSIWLVLSMSRFLYDKMGHFLISIFSLIPEAGHSTHLFELFQEGLMVIFLASMPIMVLVAFVGVVINFLAVGPVFAMEVFKFDIKKFDPVQNLKGKFKMATVVELIKSVAKITVACILIYHVMYNSLPVLIRTVSMPMASALLVFDAFLMEVVMKVGIFFLVIAVADFAYQKYNFAKEMKMEKFEVKQEHKNTEGDPHIKSKRRQIAQETAYEEGPSGGVQRAQAVVTNPTELAIAIGYKRGIDVAPYILGMGEGPVAKQMVAMAKRHEVPVVRNIRLAHKLWDEGETYEYVPEGTYELIADIMRWIQALDSENAYEYNENRHNEY
jgi:type III secretion protein U